MARLEESKSVECSLKSIWIFRLENGLCLSRDYKITVVLSNLTVIVICLPRRWPVPQKAVAVDTIERAAIVNFMLL